MMNGSGCSYYDYKDLVAAVEENETQKAIEALGEWFSLYGDAYWNGSCWDIDGNRGLYPIYKIADEECEDFELVGYEIR